ncbi:prepilin peptidase [Candidatus Woesebacteria bacterium]|nr:prepilin peptidase [Candidatus Woesebacteria bacterium]
MFLTYILIFIFGAVFGSFISAYTYRLTNGDTVLKGRSYCPKCKKGISWYDNIPVLSYVLLKGKCRKCKSKISIRYPLLEISTGTIFAAVYSKYMSVVNIYGSNCGADLFCRWVQNGGIAGLLLIFILVLILISVFVIDVEEMIIPDTLIFKGFLIFYFFYSIYFSDGLFKFLLSGFCAALFILMLHLVTNGKGMGLGDVKFSLFGGFILGFRLTAVWLFLSFILGAMVGLILISFKKAKFGKKIPFGPYLATAFVLVILFGPRLYNMMNLPF